MLVEGYDALVLCLQPVGELQRGHVGTERPFVGFELRSVNTLPLNFGLDGKGTVRPRTFLNVSSDRDAINIVVGTRLWSTGGHRDGSRSHVRNYSQRRVFQARRARDTTLVHLVLVPSVLGLR